MNTKAKIFLALTLCVMALIFVFSHQTGEESGRVGNALANVLGISPGAEDQSPAAKPLVLGLSLRKMAHIGIYALLGVFAELFFVSLLPPGRPAEVLRCALFGTGVCVAYAGLDELHQSFIDGRFAALSDVGIDALGFVPAIAAVLLIHCLVQRQVRKRDGASSHGDNT